MSSDWILQVAVISLIFAFPHCFLSYHIFLTFFLLSAVTALISLKTSKNTEVFFTGTNTDNLLPVLSIFYCFSLLIVQALLQMNFFHLRVEISVAEKIVDNYGQSSETQRPLQRLIYGELFIYVSRFAFHYSPSIFGNQTIHQSSIADFHPSALSSQCSLFLKTHCIRKILLLQSFISDIILFLKYSLIPAPTSASFETSILVYGIIYLSECSKKSTNPQIPRHLVSNFPCKIKH